MRATILFICFSLIALISFSQSKNPTATNPKNAPAIQSQNQKTSYSFGVLVASNLKAQAGDSLDLNALFQGINDAYKGRPIQLKIEECSNMAQQHVQQYSRRKGERVRKESSIFLEKNKMDPTVKSTASGLQYKILNIGTGASPLATDRVTVHYTGRLIDGTIFDSSVQKGQPATFNVGRVISGWTEALQMMHEGDKWMLFIPQELGYGAGGNNGIPPFAALIFEVELIKVN
jgi:FKBP-type peptidyl-prolyl cis-trans isomerase